ncbi:YihY/virulence factor BrkB family protein [Streptomyces sp. DHE7-1]|nr:YihY/virulence factor BrkB family protein [Streptomyces sp. DHE7-1]
MVNGWAADSFVAVLVVVVFHTGPEPARRSRHSLPGGAPAAALRLTASAGFALYADVPGTYSRLYGSLAGAQFTAELHKAKATGPLPGGDASPS